MQNVGNKPVLILSSLSVFPGVTTVLTVSRKQSLIALKEAVDEDTEIALFAEQKETQEESASIDSFFSYGTLAKVRNVTPKLGGRVQITLVGISRVMMDSIDQRTPFLTATLLEDPQEMSYSEGMDDFLKQAYRSEAESLIKDCLDGYERHNDARELRRLSGSFLEDGAWVNELLSKLPIGAKRRQDIYHATRLSDRMEMLIAILKEEKEILRAKDRIGEMVREKIDKNQRDYVLREQARAIQNELGDGVSEQNEELQKKIDELAAPEEIKNALNKELKRLRMAPPGSSDGSVIRNYLDVCLDIPWEIRTEENNSIAHARQILEEDHYGLEKVKERVLEYLAVRNLNGGKESTIICLYGPPGVGKTSIAKSIARALNRKYVRISLGGLHDESEIRGHRKTYLGAMPGRIIAALRQAKVKNPLILLDELDKMASDHRGDPASAMLEVLDSEQNHTFRDNFVELPFDLSEVVFIATANDPSQIPGPLKDRVEMIELPSYTSNEKFHIARNYLVEKQREKHGLKKEQFEVSDDAIRKIIEAYTKEAGVRELERMIAVLCRKTARMILEENVQSVQVTEENLSSFLGREKFHKEELSKEGMVGIVNGLAWTSVGGVILEIEVNTMPGKGNLILTGKLGDVMKESARIALSYVRSVAKEYGVKEEYFETHDFHIHVPEGAVPKDGPSAGVTMSTALLSAVTGKKVRADLAMTGEVTLRGRVLPIGGLKEKMLAAKTAGMTEVLVPAENKAEAEEIPEEIRKDLKFSFVRDMTEVAEKAFL